MDEVIEVFRGMHRGVRFMFDQSIKNVLSYEEMKQRSDDKGNSIAWLMWHLARIEDQTVHTFIQGKPQILVSGGWQERIEIEGAATGLGFGDEEVAEVTRAMNVEAVDDYWKAAQKASYEWLRSISREDLEFVPDLDARRAESEAPNEPGNWDLWRGRTAGFIFSGTVISHGYIHIGQMQEIGGRLGRVGWV